MHLDVDGVLKKKPIHIQLTIRNRKSSKKRKGTDNLFESDSVN